jgi:isopenicillin-N epimerase
LPVAEVIANLRSTHPATMFVVDGAHSAGMIEKPIPEGCDVWVGNLHKWLSAPRPAAAIICMNPDLYSALAPLSPSWGFEDGFPKSFEWQGTADYSAYLAVPAAITFQEQWSWSQRNDHNRGVVDGAAELLRKSWGTEQHIDPSLEAPWMRMVKIPASRPLTKVEADSTVERIGIELKAECMLMTVGETSYVRLSAHMYNEVGDYAALEPIRRFLP